MDQALMYDSVIQAVESFSKKYGWSISGSDRAPDEILDKNQLGKYLFTIWREEEPRCIEVVLRPTDKEGKIKGDIFFMESWIASGEWDKEYLAAQLAEELVIVQGAAEKLVAKTGGMRLYSDLAPFKK